MAIFKLDAQSQSALESLGVSLNQRHGDYHVGARIEFEPPVAVAAEMAYNFPISVGAFSHLNGGFIQRVTIGRYCSFARDVQIGHGFHPHDWLSVSPLQYGPRYRGFSQFAARNGAANSEVVTIPFVHGKPTIIGNDVWIGNHAFIADGIIIGDGAIIGAGSVVTKDVEPYSIVAGSPAKTIRSRFDPALVERMLKLQWWKYSLADFGATDFSKPAEVLDQLEKLLMADCIKEYAPEPVCIPLKDI